MSYNRDVMEATLFSIAAMTTERLNDTKRPGVPTEVYHRFNVETAIAKLSETSTVQHGEEQAIAYMRLAAECIATVVALQKIAPAEKVAAEDMIKVDPPMRPDMNYDTKDEWDRPVGEGVDS